MANVVDLLETRMTLAGLSEYVGGLRSAGHAVEGFGSSIEALQDKTTRLAAASAASAAVAAGGFKFLLQSVKEAGEGERLGVAFAGVTRNAAEASKEVSALGTSLAGQRFGDEEVVRLGLHMRIMGADARTTQETISTLADAVAAGAGDFSTLEGATETLSRAMERHTLNARTLRALQSANIPVNEILASKLHLTAEGMKELNLTGSEADRAIRLLLEGMKEKFGGGVAKDLNTIDGASAAAQVSLHNVREELGTQLASPFVGVLKDVKGLADGFVNLPGPIKKAVAEGILFASGAATLVSLRFAAAAIQTYRLGAENTRLMNKALQAAGGEETQAGATGTLTGALTGALGPTTGLKVQTNLLAKAHWAAAEAAEAQALAEGRIGGAGLRLPIAVPGGPGAIPLPAGAPPPLGPLGPTAPRVSGPAAANYVIRPEHGVKASDLGLGVGAAGAAGAAGAGKAAQAAGAAQAAAGTAAKAGGGGFLKSYFGGAGGGLLGGAARFLPGIGMAYTAYELRHVADHLAPNDAKGPLGTLRRGSDALMNLTLGGMFANLAFNKDHNPLGDAARFASKDLGLPMLDFGAMFGGKQPEGEKATASADLKETNALLKEIRDALHSKDPVADTNRIAGARQLLAAQFARSLA